MRWFRRNEPLHVRLAREGEHGEPSLSPLDAPLIPSPKHPLPEWFEIQSLLKQRDGGWDSLASVEAPEVEGDEVEFVALPDGSLIVDEQRGDASLGPLADAIETELERPYRAVAVRKEGRLWVVGARTIDVVRLPGVHGEAVELTLLAGERTASVAGDLSPLEELAAERGLEEYAVQAERLDEDLWEVYLSPL